MKSKKVYKLRNGLKVVLYQDTTKHCSLASLFVRFGGKYKNVEINNDNYKIKDGMAHFIEHLLIEHSLYGNTLLEFEKKHTISNGYTTKDNTEYVINSVVNFEEDLVRLINIVNNANFTDDNINETKKAIIKEKMMSNDNNFESLAKLDYESVFANIRYPNILGEIDDITAISYDDVKICYDTFYQPKNEVLIISGNFSINKIMKIIKETYKNIYNTNIEYKIPLIEEKNEVVKKEGNIKKDIHMDYVRINYKINVKNINTKEKIKLDFYLNYFLSYLFDSSSKIYTKLVADKVCLYDINYFYLKEDDFLVVKIGTTTDNHQEFIDAVQDVIKRKEIDKEDFELRKKQTILEIILREDNLSSTISPFIDNIMIYGYDEMDRIEDIQNQSFKDYKSWIERLDFSNFCVTRMLKENKLHDE